MHSDDRHSTFLYAKDHPKDHNGADIQDLVGELYRGRFVDGNLGGLAGSADRALRARHVWQSADRRRSWPVTNFVNCAGDVGRFFICGLAAVMGRRFSKIETAILLCDISVLAVYAAKNELKFYFGRTWPDSWGPEIASFLRDNAYGFHFFHSSKSFESFPSGHAAVIAAVISVLWIFYPKLRTLWSVCIVAADIALVAMNIHFLSDVVAGSFVGVSSGLFTVAAWRASDYRKRITNTDDVGCQSAYRTGAFCGKVGSSIVARHDLVKKVPGTTFARLGQESTRCPMTDVTQPETAQAAFMSTGIS